MTTTTRTPSWLKAVEAAVVAEAEVTRLRNLWQVELRNAERLADENDILQAKLDAVRDKCAEFYLQAQHSKAWHIGEATTDEWNAAYVVVDEAAALDEEGT
jgi:hypothetical protein